MSNEPEIVATDEMQFENQRAEHRGSQIKQIGKKGKLSSKKLRTLWCLLLSIGINQTLYMNVSSLLPNFARDNYCVTDT
jgi:hypothetical protein